MIDCYKNKVDILAFKWTGKNKKDVKIIKNKLKKYPEYKLKILKDDILCISTLYLYQ